MPVLLSTSTSGNVEASLMQGPKEYLNHMTTFGMMGVLDSRLLRIVTTHTSYTVVTLSRHQRIAGTKTPPVMLIHIKDDVFPCIPRPLTATNP